LFTAGRHFMPKIARDRRSFVPLVVGFLLAGLALASALWLTERQEASVALVRHTLNVESRLAQVLSALQDAETGQRGYMLTGVGSFLQPYEDGRRAVGPALTSVAQLTVDNPQQQKRIGDLQRVANAKLDELDAVMGRYDQGDKAGAIAQVRSGRGKRLMDDARSIVAEMSAEETRLLGVRDASAGRTAGLLKIGLVGSFALLCALALLTIREARRRLAEARMAHDAMVDVMAKREASEAQVRQLQKIESLGQLTGGIAHDFNNMLTIVIGSLDLARRKLGDGDPAVARLVDHAMEGANRAATLTARLLAFSRQSPLSPQLTDVNKLVSNMSELFRSTLGEQVAMETVLAGGLWTTNIDTPQLENALLNLAVNARDAMSEHGGGLTIETANTHLDDDYARANADTRAGQYVMLAVSDTGVGMPPDVAAKAFDPFFTTKSVGNGTGVGLSQVYGFIKQSGGHAKIYSEEGRGKTVKLYLPRAFGAEVTQGAPAPRVESIPAGAREELILVVEDEAQVRRLSVEALRDLGYTVRHACDGREALEVLEQQPGIRLLFTDIVMPGMTGRELADQATAAQPELKVLYTTGYTRNAVVHNGTLDPGVAFLQKPFTIEQLAAKVRERLDLPQALAG
jgi:signal transduction histidine kinase/ActR/RegA family two-component response regulator